MASLGAKWTSARSNVATEKFDKAYLVVVAFLAIAALILLGEVATIGSAAAQTQTSCGERTVFLRALEQSHSEKPQAIGISTDGKLFEVLVSDTGSWTILVMLPNRLTCLVAAGESWESVASVVNGVSS